MDFGAVGFDGLVCSSNNISSNSFASNPVISAASNRSGGGFLKQERTGTEDDWRDSKMAKTSDDFSSASKAMLFQHSHKSSTASSNSSTFNSSSSINPSLTRSNTSLLSDGQHMLSFSSPNQQQSVTLPYYPHTSAAAYVRNTGYGSGGGLNAGSMHGVIAGVRGPFTPSQWMELEHQALIYKYITANAPIPSNLLIPIRKALETAGFSTFPGGHLRHNTFGWGAFHFGFSNSSDPEPGRCRRTDGKKWRCSRDAVADQKYCERHMNRGRHRSRKPVEGQTGHSVSGGPTTTTAKLMPMSSSTSTTVVASCDSASNILSHSQPGKDNLASSQLNRNFINKGGMGEKIHDKAGNQFFMSKQHNPTGESARSEFGLVYSDSLLNPLHKNTSLINDVREPKSQQHSLRQFMDDWPHSDRTQLSISIPMASASSDFMSTTSSPTNERLTLSPLRLSRELDPTQMGLGMGNEPNHRQANWIPISWETSMGGPLGEVLHSTNNNIGETKNASALNLMTEGWDSSPRMALSPTGVLQKTAFGSLSNSSAGSSPRMENNLRGPTLISSSFPSL